MSFEALCQAVESGNTGEAEELTQKLLDAGENPSEIIAALTEAMDRLGELFARLEIFLPQLILAGNSLKAVVDILRPKIMESGEQGISKGKVVLGVVKGDLHEIGKNIVKLMLETNGFEVKDLGYDVDSLTFIKEAEAMEADVIGASALITTTMPGQLEIIELLKEKGIRDRYKVVIGGAPTGPEWADEIGADLWCADATSAPKLITELLDS
jgi:corrinoid protein of di/trimethylamine methyltransferase